jgi:hypothetical protein
MGKWTETTKHLQPLPDPDTPYFQRLARRADELMCVPLDDLARRYGTADGTRKRLEDEVSDATLERDAIGRAMLRKMENAKLDSVVTGGYRWTPSPEPYPQVKDRVALREWAVRNGMEDALAIPHQTLKATVKAALENHEELPEGIDIFAKTTFSRRRAT